MVLNLSKQIPVLNFIGSYWKRLGEKWKDLPHEWLGLAQQMELKFGIQEVADWNVWRYIVKRITDFYRRSW